MVLVLGLIQIVEAVKKRGSLNEDKWTFAEYYSEN